MGAVRVWLPLRSHLYNGACMRGWPSEETDGCVNIKAVVCGRGTIIALSPGGLFWGGGMISQWKVTIT